MLAKSQRQNLSLVLNVACWLGFLYLNRLKLQGRSSSCGGHNQAVSSDTFVVRYLNLGTSLERYPLWLPISSEKNHRDYPPPP